MKKLISILSIITVICSSFSVMTANAQVNEDKFITEVICPASLYADNVYSYIDINGSSVTCRSVVTGKSNVTKIVITQTLQKSSANGWYDYKSPKTKTFYSSSATYINTYSNVIIGSYRTKTVAKVYKGSSYETVTVYS